MPYRIIRNDITKVKADAIVNPANPEPIIGGGTDRAIHEAAGPALLEARKQIGRIAVGKSAATPAFGLPARYVLHTVGPIWIDGQQGEEAMLREAYDAALSLADALGCKSVAFPLLAAGTYAFPHDIALAVAIRAFTDFLLEHEMQIELVLFNGKAFGLAASIFDDLKSYVDDNYVSERHYAEHSPRQDNVWYSRRVEKPSPMDILRRKKLRKEAEKRANDESALPIEMPSPAAAPSLSLADILGQQEKSFSEYLLDLLREREGKDSEVYKRAEVSKQLFSKILNNRDYQPTKDTVVQLAIGLELDLPQTQAFLGRAGYALTRSSKTDLVVQYCIEHRIYSVTFINEALADCGLPLLKTGLKV